MKQFLLTGCVIAAIAAGYAWNTMQADRKMQADRSLKSVDTGISCEGWSTADFFKEATVADIRRCLEQGKNPNARNENPKKEQENGFTPLHYAVMYNKNPAVVEALVRVGADVNDAANKLGKMPLHVAAANNENPLVIVALLTAGADVNVRTDVNVRGGIGHTPLHGAAMSNENPLVIETLLAAGADVKAVNEFDFTPLHLAVFGFNKNPAVAEALIRLGADVNAKTDVGLTPIAIALMLGTGNSAVASVIRDAGGRCETPPELYELTCGGR